MKINILSILYYISAAFVSALGLLVAFGYLTAAYEWLLYILIGLLLVFIGIQETAIEEHREVIKELMRINDELTSYLKRCLDSE